MEDPTDQLPQNHANIQIPTEGEVNANPDFVDISLASLPVIVLTNCIPLLNKMRITSVFYTMIIGKAHAHAYRASNLGFKIWSEMVAASNADLNSPIPFPADECPRYWNSFTYNNRFSFKSIIFMARIDSPHEFNMFKDYRTGFYIQAALSGSHADMAMLLYWLFIDTHFYAGSKLGWFIYTNGKWIRMLENYHLGRAMSGWVVDFLRKRIAEKNEFEIKPIERLIELLKNDLAGRADQEAKLATMKKEIGKYLQLIERVKNNTFKRSVLRECCELFFIPDMESLMDTNDSITSYLNGVIEAGKERCNFRAALPEEFILRTVPLAYPTDISGINNGWAHPKVKEVMTWLKQVYVQRGHAPDGTLQYDPKATEQVVDYILRLWCSSLEGINHKVILVMTGSGNNSKSMIKKIHKAMFGPYCQDLDVDALKGSRGGANPAMAKLEGAKQGWITEPNNDQELVDGFLKAISGGDSFFARGLFKDGKDITPTALLFIVCNNIPPIPPGKAMKNRLRILEHSATWSPDAPVDEWDQLNQALFKDDPNFERKIPELAPYLLWILTAKYIEYKRDGIKTPQVITDRTEKYWAEIDPYAKFIREVGRLAVIPGSITEENKKGVIDATSRVTRNELYDVFSNWFRRNYPTQTMARRSTILYEMEARIGPVSSDGAWYGMYLDQTEVFTGVRPSN